MNIRHLVLFAAVAIISANSAFAQTDFFWSTNNLNTGATNADLSAEFNPGESSTLYLYYTTNGPADSDLNVGAFVDVVTSQPGVVQFDSAQTLDFDITFFGSTLGVRWGDSFGLANSVAEGEIDELGAFTFFTGEGLLESHNGLSGLKDEGYDLLADAFLFATVEFTVPADATPGSSTNIILSTGSGNIVNDGMPVAVEFGNATISVADLEPVLGDLTGDGIVDMADVQPFVQVIVSREYNEVADINMDGVVNLLDIRPFVDLLKL